MIRSLVPPMLGSLRTRLLLLVIGTMLVSLVGGAIAIRQVVTSNFMRQKMLSGELLTTSIVHDVTYESSPVGPSAGQRVVEKYITYYRDITRLTLYDRDGQVIASAGSPRPDDPERAAAVRAALEEAKPTLVVSRSRDDGDALRSVSPIMRGSRIAGAVVVEMSMRDLATTLTTMDRQIATLIGIILVLVAAGLFFSLRSLVLARLRRLMEVTGEIRAGRYDVRIDDRHRDEIGTLAQALDQMTEELQASRRQIEDDHRLLEDRVHAATEELSRAYDGLKSAQGQLVLNEKMASLGVLIAGVAHEINTPVGAILNVARSLHTQIDALPASLGTFWEASEPPAEQMVECLVHMLHTASQPFQPVPHEVQRSMEARLKGLDMSDPRRKAAVLCKLNVTDLDWIERHAPCLKHEAFFRLADSCASMAQAAHIAESSCQKIAEIVKALKFYAYADNEKVGLVNLNESIATALVLLRHQLKHTATVELQLAPDLPPIRCSNDIHQVWTNLLSNAHDAVRAAHEQGRGRIAVVTERQGDSIVIRIEDDGGGIPAEHVGRIFDPFFTTKGVGKGTGLGLSIVSGIVSKQGGAVTVQSRPGCTEFIITLPMSVVAEHATASAVPQDAAANIAAEQRAA